MSPSRRFLPLLFLVGPCVSLATPASAQLGSVGDRIRDRVEDDVTRRIEQRAVDAARRTLDLAEDAIVCAVTDEECIDDARDNGQEPVIVNEDGEPISGYEPAGSSDNSSVGNSGGSNSGEVWANYDFIPGERVLFAHDFEGTRVGNFPSRLSYIAGDMDVVRLGSSDDTNLALHSGTDVAGSGANGCFTIELPETLPEQFTFEFRAMHQDPGDRVKYFMFSDGSDDTPDTRCNYPPPVHLAAIPLHQGLAWAGAESNGQGGMVENEWATVALGCDGPYCKMYVNGTRVANVPRWDFPRADKLHFFFNGAGAMFVDDIRIAEGGARSLYDDLQADGFVSTTAIRFDTGSAVLKPESGGILGEVLMMMEEHNDLRLLVEGHTDADGTDDSNQTLSQERAEAVASWLIANGIDAGRLDTIGHGESQPASDNGTTEGKAQNRRVVFRQL